MLRPKMPLLCAIALILSLTCSIYAGCPVGDVHEDADCEVNWLDMRDFAEEWLNASCSAPECRADIDGVAGVNMRDFARLAENWLEKGSVTLVINEFMASNDGTIEYPEDSGNYPDWFEIYNYGEEDIDIGGMYVRDDSHWHLIPTGYSSQTTVKAGGHLLLWADSGLPAGPLHVGFGLGKSSDEIGIYDENRNPIDVVPFSNQVDDMSRGRLPDGSYNWITFEIGGATPGSENRGKPVEVMISEIMHHPGHEENTPENIGEEYIELYNDGEEPVGLLGWRFTNGVNYTVTDDIILGVDQYYVIASDANAFLAKYPGVTNVVGGWEGRLSNSGEEIELVDSAGVLVDIVRYADQGDWAIRELGPVDHEHRGWMWADSHDGDGDSLELINPDVSNEYGQNWAASTGSGGTPGATNSVSASDIAPLILDMEHFPIIPGSSDAVTVTARIIDELATGVTVTLHHRLDAEPTFNMVTMFDDGAHGDGDADDGVYAGEIPAQADGEIVEFYVRAGDTGANSRTWPAASIVDETPEQVTNALYQVDNSYNADTPWVPGSQPVYYIIMIETERAELEDIGDGGDPFFGEARSNAQMNATFISVDGVDTKVRYSTGVRNRGNRTRAQPPNNFRVNFAHDKSWKGVTALTINSKYPHLQVMGSAMFRLAGMPAPEATAVQLRVNGRNLAESDYSRMYDSYVAMEVYDSDWADNHFPDDSAGNLYRCTYEKLSTGGTTYGDLDYKENPGGVNPDPDDYRDNYPKQTNRSQDDYSDLFNLIDKLNNTSILDANLLEQVGQVANLDQWMRYMATDAFAGNREGGLYEGEGDDYAMYRGAIDPRFWLLPHDLDTLFGQGDHSYDPDWEIFSYADVAGLERLFDQDEIWKAYYRQYKKLAETVFAPENANPIVDQLLASWVPQSEIEGTNGIKQFITERPKSILYGGYSGSTDDPQIPQEFAIDCDLTVVSGFYRTTGSVVASGNIHGRANAIDTSSVLVNGQAADWSQRYGTWVLDEGLALNPGINRITVQAFDGPRGTGEKAQSGHIDIWYDDGGVSTISGTIASNTTLDAASGPWHVTGDVTVSGDVTLTIEPGATVYFDQDTRLTVSGRLLAEGAEFERIRLTRRPGASATWDGLHFSSDQDNRLTYADMEYSSADGESIDLSSSKILIDNVTWTGTTKTILDISSSSLIVRNSVFPSTSSQTVSGHHLLGADPYMLFENNEFGVCTGTKQDVLDFSTSGSPVMPRFINNVFLGGGDDALDLDGTGAYVAGNLFMNFHSNFDPSEGESYGITTGYDASESSNHVIVGNIFIDCDNAALVKDRSWIRFVHNVVVRCSGAGINFREPLETDVDPGEGGYLEGNIFWETPTPLAYFYVGDPTWGTTDITVNHCLIAPEWHYLGQGNIDADPLFVDPNEDFHLKSASGAIGTGPCGLDMGAYVPSGAAICGEPGPVTYRTNATLTVGGPGITHYKYSLNSPTGPWSAETSVDAPIELTGLSDGESYTVYAIGKDAAGIWQSDSSPTASHTWTIDTSHSQLIINEVLAHTHGADPDVIELYYDGPASIDLTGMGLTDDPAEPNKFEFNSSSVLTTTMNPGDYMILYGDLTTFTNHLGFAISADGEGLYLYDKANPDGSHDLLDSVEFGPQINDYSIGRLGWDRQWKLNKLTFGSANIAQPLGDPDMLKINEWLANGQVLFDDDFVELHNPHPQPVSLGGMYMTDDPVMQPNKHQIVPLSFVPPEGFAVFRPNDGNDPSELDFKYSADGEMIGLFDAGLNMIDQVLYGPQTTDVSQGRTPDGSAEYNFFSLPTPGVSNPQPPTLITTTTVLAPENATKRAIIPTSAGHVGETWKSDPDFDDSSWLPCIGSPGGVGFETNPSDAVNYVSLITLDVEAQMDNINETCYIRIPFTVDGADLADFTGMTLKIRYDDGFVPYINGVELVTAKRNFTGTPQWDSGAGGGHSDSAAVLFEYIDVSGYLSALRSGDNVLGIHGLNDGIGSSDFLISAELEASITEIDPGSFPYEDDLDVLAGLRITELMYNAPSGSNYDYVELQNISGKPIQLGGVRFLDGIEFEFPAGQLNAGEYIVVVGNLTAFRNFYGYTANVAGEYAGGLSGGGEDIVLSLAWPLEAAVMRFGYSDAWYPTTDGGGHSLTITDPTAHPATWDDAESWHAAIPSPGGS